MKKILTISALLLTINSSLYAADSIKAIGEKNQNELLPMNDANEISAFAAHCAKASQAKKLWKGADKKAIGNAGDIFAKCICQPAFAAQLDKGYLEYLYNTPKHHTVWAQMVYEGLGTPEQFKKLFITGGRKTLSTKLKVTGVNTKEFTVTINHFKEVHKVT